MPDTIPTTLDALQACLAAIVLQLGEPLIDPPRVAYTLSRPSVEGARGRRITFVYTVDDFNPMGTLTINVEG